MTRRGRPVSAPLVGVAISSWVPEPSLRPPIRPFHKSAFARGPPAWRRLPRIGISLLQRRLCRFTCVIAEQPRRMRRPGTTRSIVNLTVARPLSE